MLIFTSSQYLWWHNKGFANEFNCGGSTVQKSCMQILVINYYFIPAFWLVNGW